MKFVVFNQSESGDGFTCDAIVLEADTVLDAVKQMVEREWGANEGRLYFVCPQDPTSQDKGLLVRAHGYTKFALSSLRIVD